MNFFSNFLGISLCQLSQPTPLQLMISKAQKLNLSSTSLWRWFPHPSPTNARLEIIRCFFLCDQIIYLLLLGLNSFWGFYLDGGLGTERGEYIIGSLLEFFVQIAENWEGGHKCLWQIYGTRNEWCSYCIGRKKGLGRGASPEPGSRDDEGSTSMR